MTDLTLIVTGGRDYEDRDTVFHVLDAIHAKCRISRIIHGKCRTGADRWAAEWCVCRGVEQKPYPVTDEEWRTVGRRAGPLRNARMFDENPDVNGVVAFPGGAGTRDCAEQGRRRGVTVWEPVKAAT